MTESMTNKITVAENEFLRMCLIDELTDGTKRIIRVRRSAWMEGFVFGVIVGAVSILISVVIYGSL